MELSFLGSTEYLLRAKLSIIFDSSKGLGIYLRKPVCHVFFSDKRFGVSENNP